MKDDAVVVAFGKVRIFFAVAYKKKANKQTDR